MSAGRRWWDTGTPGRAAHSWRTETSGKQIHGYLADSPTMAAEQILLKTHTSTVGVDDADSQRAVLHVALQVEHGALTRRHGHAAQLSCEKGRAILLNHSVSVN